MWCRMPGRRKWLIATAAVLAALALAAQPALAQEPSPTQDQYQQPGIDGGGLTPAGAPFDPGAFQQKPVVVSPAENFGAALSSREELPYTGSDLLLLVLAGAALLSLGLLLAAGNRARRRLVARRAG